MRLGSNTPAAYYLGSAAVSALYLGASQVWTVPDATAPTATGSMGTQDVNGDLTFTLTDLSENSTLGISWTSTDQSAATPAAIKTAAEGGAALTDQLSIGTQAVTVGGGPYTLTGNLPAGFGPATAYYQAVLWDAAGNVSTAFTGSVSLDTTTPTDWAFTGSTVTTIPTSEPWTYSGSTVTNIPGA